jgi:cellobiose-specific phosphotransferase system component IIB
VPGSAQADESASSSAPSGTGTNAGIEAAPQRNLQEELGRLADALTAPKKETQGEKFKKHMGTVGQHVSNEKQATHVSVNTHHSE